MSRPRRPDRYISAMLSRTVAELSDDPDHDDALDGASLLGRCDLNDRLVVRVGLWLDGTGRVTRARFNATTCASLVAYAEAACTLAEQGDVEDCTRAERLREAVAGVHPVHHDRAAAVASAFSRALRARSSPAEERA